MKHQEDQKNIDPQKTAKWLKVAIAILNAILNAITTSLKPFRNKRKM